MKRWDFTHCHPRLQKNSTNEIIYRGFWKFDRHGTYFVKIVTRIALSNTKEKYENRIKRNRLAPYAIKFSIFPLFTIIQVKLFRGNVFLLGTRYLSRYKSGEKISRPLKIINDAGRRGIVLRPLEWQKVDASCYFEANIRRCKVRIAKFCLIV